MKPPDRELGPATGSGPRPPQRGVARDDDSPLVVVMRQGAEEHHHLPTPRRVQVPVGSSARTTAGSFIKVRATATRFRSPPDNEVVISLQES